MFDVITFGSATWDIFIKEKKLLSFLKKNHFQFPLGEKINFSEIAILPGGGGINVAVGLARQKLKVAYCGGIGDDILGEELVKELKKQKINTKFIQKVKNSHTNLSIILAPKDERTILVYRGSSKEISLRKVSKKEIIKTKWFYLAPLVNFYFLKEIINLGEKNNIRIFINPNRQILTKKRKELKEILKKTEVLLLNQEEFLLLLKKQKFTDNSLLFAVRKFFKGILVITNGEKEIRVLDKENNLYTVLPLKIKVIDRTGAGDAFGSGFLGGLIKFQDIRKALDLALKNALNCIQKLGAHNYK
jgi:sugar/nucleoside kinase (ribokinase family)